MGPQLGKANNDKISHRQHQRPGRAQGGVQCGLHPNPYHHHHLPSHHHHDPYEGGSEHGSKQSLVSPRDGRHSRGEEGRCSFQEVFNQLAAHDDDHDGDDDGDSELSDVDVDGMKVRRADHICCRVCVIYLRK